MFWQRHGPGDRPTDSLRFRDRFEGDRLHDVGVPANRLHPLRRLRESETARVKGIVFSVQKDV